MKNKMDISKKFSSKADTLTFLQKKLKKGKIEEILSFTVKEWEENKEKIIQAVEKKFFPNDVIVRSSAKGEDSLESTEAGKYKSIQKISTKNKSHLENSIAEVIKTYEDKCNKNTENQVLIQKQTTGVITNGVVFTRTPDIGSPYYVINFIDSKDTDNVTKGETSNMIKIFEKCEKKLVPEKWKKLISVINEITKIFGTNHLDIEFGITKKNIVIFQVRPLTTINENSNVVNLSEKISKLIYKNQIKYQKLSSKPGKKEKTYFSDMADWNPAEIIGNNPNPLDYSLYDFLFMQDAWQEGRVKIGYEKSNQSNLMEKFGNKPYINIRKSFYSLFPDQLNEKLKNKLLKFYLKKLRKNPHLHDKVEFDILFSCFDFNFDQRKKELEDFGFDQNEIKEIKETLIEFTNKIIKDFPKIKKKCIDDFKQMNRNREKINSLILNGSNDEKFYCRAAENLLRDCKKFGAINFASMARIAFIGNILLKSLELKNVVSQNFVNEVMSSISSPLSEIQKDLDSYSKNEISKEEFLSKYGHLRPGTYDITAKRYDENHEFLENIKFLTKSNINLKKYQENTKLKSILKKNKITVSEYELINFVKESTQLREVLKFEFTKNLSDSLKLITMAGKKLSISIKDLSYLEIKDIFIAKNKNRTKIISYWNKRILHNKKIKKINEFLITPPLIFSENDFQVITYNLSKPNFITNNKVTGELERISNLQNENSDFSGKIIFIENADPGFDWIFAKNPKGLVTKYGGVASHMSIRCAELGLPAAIGIGEIISQKIDNAKTILLDCENQQIIVLESIHDDQFVEIKRILKSLGYIK